VQTSQHAILIPQASSSSLLIWLQLSLLALAPILVFLSVVSYSGIALGTDQARLMFPALSAMAVWVGTGLVGLADWARGRPGGFGTATQTAAASADPNSFGPAWPGAAADRRLVAGFAAGMVAFGLVVLVVLIRPAFAPPHPLPAETVPASAPLAIFGDGFQLLAAELPAGPLPTGQPAAVRVVWRAGQPLADDLRPVLQLVHADGWLAAEWNHAPAGGRYSTDRWQPGEAIADDYLIAPQPPTPGTYTVQVGVRPFGGEWLPVSSPSAAAPFLPLGQLTYR
jgi:hypothetical protein